jgi:hypothetical protein
MSRLAAAGSEMDREVSRTALGHEIPEWVVAFLGWPAVGAYEALLVSPHAAWAGALRPWGGSGRIKLHSYWRWECLPQFPE